MSKRHKTGSVSAPSSSELSSFALTDSPSMELNLIKSGLEKTHIISIADDEVNTRYAHLKKAIKSL